ncbi:AraC family transcriptional regulator [Pseudochryseolinea flava]|uniref:HTH araC/xylS-type domain-containing protein n=1 Tax=Pseudochryseolinea flava TaxID=2059302 RepID=A0A364XVA3_9BACT|nr:AraC family transcriptional regulator [Pseudochryseolinea flava]RAV98223.1 hypothetical protein DQQ10_24795 [Pseudochryseolinea flava]
MIIPSSGFHLSYSGRKQHPTPLFFSKDILFEKKIDDLNNAIPKNYKLTMKQKMRCCTQWSKRRLPDPQFAHLTILAIALESGFNSKSSFNGIFMKSTGMAPKTFKEESQQIVLADKNTIFKLFHYSGIFRECSDLQYYYSSSVFTAPSHK